MDTTSNYFGNLKGKAIAEIAVSVAGKNYQQAIAYLVDPSALPLLSKLLPGNLIADFITADSQLRGANKFYTEWSLQDLDTLIEILRIGFVTGIFYERRVATSNRPRRNKRDSNKTRKSLQDNGSQLS